MNLTFVVAKLTRQRFFEKMGSFYLLRR